MGVYSRLLENVLLPAHNTVKRRQYTHLRAFLEESQWWPDAKLREFQWGELRKLIHHAWETVPFYRSRFEQVGLTPETIRTPEDYRRVPSLTREEVNQHREQLCSTQWVGRLQAHATGGSSGVPTRFYITTESFDWRTAATQRVYAWPGCHLGEPTLYLWGAPVGRQPWFQRKKMQAFRAVRREYIFSTFQQTDETWETIWMAARRLKPRFVVAYVSSLEQFTKYLLATGKSLDGIIAVIAAAEPVFDVHRDLTRRALGAPLFNTYGSREFMSIGAECHLHEGLHLNAENLYVETRLPSSEGPSEILVTDLHNYGMPFLRYEIGDVGLLDDSPCVCGRSLPRLRSVEGRVLDILRTPSGKIVPGEFFPHILKEIPEIAEFQVEQKALDHILVRVVLREPLSAQSTVLIEGEIGKAFGRETRVEVLPVEEIPRRASGKRRVTIGLSS